MNEITNEIVVVNASGNCNKLNRDLSACQLGITVTSLGLGWLGEPTFEKLLHPLFNYFSNVGSPNQPNPNEVTVIPN
jgi:CBS domain containing-hemolysin-like protein